MTLQNINSLFSEKVKMTRVPYKEAYKYTINLVKFFFIRFEEENNSHLYSWRPDHANHVADLQSYLHNTASWLLIAVSHLKKGWRHLFLSQVRLDMVHCCLREGLQDTQKQTNTHTQAESHKLGIQAIVFAVNIKHLHWFPLLSSAELPCYGVIQIYDKKK